MTRTDMNRKPVLRASVVLAVFALAVVPSGVHAIRDDRSEVLCVDALGYSLLKEKMHLSLESNAPQADSGKVLVPDCSPVNDCPTGQQKANIFGKDFCVSAMEVPPTPTPPGKAPSVGAEVWMKWQEVCATVSLVPIQCTSAGLLIIPDSSPEAMAACQSGDWSEDPCYQIRGAGRGYSVAGGGHAVAVVWDGYVTCDWDYIQCQTPDHITYRQVEQGAQECGYTKASTVAIVYVETTLVGNCEGSA